MLLLLYDYKKTINRSEEQDQRSRQLLRARDGGGREHRRAEARAVRLRPELDQLGQPPRVVAVVRCICCWFDVGVLGRGAGRSVRTGQFCSRGAALAGGLKRSNHTTHTTKQRDTAAAATGPGQTDDKKRGSPNASLRYASRKDRQLAYLSATPPSKATTMRLGASSQPCLVCVVAAAWSSVFSQGGEGGRGGARERGRQRAKGDREAGPRSRI